MTIQITVIIIAICAAVLYVASTVRHISDKQADSRTQAEYFSLLALKEQRQAEADRETRAANYFGMQMAMKTLRDQTQAQAAANLETVKTLKIAVDSMGASREAADTLNDMQTRAIVGAYTQYLMEDKRKKDRKYRIEDKQQQKQPPKPERQHGRRYWEEVAADDYI